MGGYLIYLQVDRLLFKSYGKIFEYIKNELNKNLTIKKIIISLVITLFNLLNTLMCPGNSLRKIKSATKDFPTFFETSFFDKLRICIASTIEHFTSIPDAIFITMSILTGVLCYQKVKGIKRYIALIPSGICIGLTTYFFITRIIKQHITSYLRPDTNVYAGSTEYVMQYVMMILGIIYLIAMLWSLIYCCTGIKEYYLVIGTYCIGILSRFVLLLSPTMIASGTRVYFYFYMAMIACIGQLMGKVNNKIIKKFLLFILISGVIMNLLTIAIKGH